MAKKETNLTVSPSKPRSQDSLTQYVLLVLAACLSLSALAALRFGGLAYLRSDGSVAFAARLQTSGSDDSMVLGVAAAAFGVFAVLALALSWVPSRRSGVTAAVFLAFWLVPLPFFYTEVASYRQTVFAAKNWPLAAFLVLYWSSPLLALILTVHQAVRRRLTTR